MGMLGRLTSIARGFLWLVRSTGMRQSLHQLEDHLKQVGARVTHAISQIDEVVRHAGCHSIAEVQGRIMFLPPRDAVINDFLRKGGVWEPLMTELVRKELKRGDIAVDIGAHIGYYTLIFAQIVGEEGKVFAFEPDPINFALLKTNVMMNGYKNVILEKKAVAHISGQIKLFLCEDNRGDHRIYDSQDGRQWVDAEASRLDDYFEGFPEGLNLLKLDIQGAEAWAIEGMRSQLKKQQRLKIITEFWPVGLKRSGVEPRAYLSMLQEHGFKFYDINEREGSILPVTIPQLLERYVPEKENHTNLLCLRET